MKRIFYLFILFFTLSLFFLIRVAEIESAPPPSGNFTLSVASGITVTMGDSSGTIPVTITNDPGSSTYIGYVKINFDASIYYVGFNTSPPTGWQVTGITNGLGQAFVEFEVLDPGDPTYRIDPGESLTLNVVITGPRSGNDYLPIPADSQDITDHVLNKCYKLGGKESEAGETDNKLFAQSGTCGTCGPGEVQDCFQRKALYSSISALPLSVGPGDTITIIQTVNNRSSATQTLVRPSITDMVIGNGIISTGTADASRTSGPTPASVTIASGNSQTYQWTYTASGLGSLKFCNSARNIDSTATSLSSCSNTVSVGDFTANILISPVQVVSSQQVTVKMTVTNNGSTTLNNITPTLNPPTFNPPTDPLAGYTKISGPVPGNLGGLVPGESDIFQWIYEITGSVDTTFTFSGYAETGTGLRTTPDPAISNQGIISAYSVEVSPDTICSGSTNVTLTFKAYNLGGRELQQILINTPDAGFVYSSASGGCTTNWAVLSSGSPTKIEFSTSSDYIPIGGSCEFSVTYSVVPTVASNTDYSFKVDIWDLDTPTNKNPRASIGVIVKVAVYCINLLAIPDVLAPNCTSTLVATVNPAPPDGSVLIFSASAGTIYDVTTTTGGEAQAIYRAPNPYDPAFTSATVTATYNDMSADTVITLCDPAVPPCPEACSSSYFKKIQWQEVMP